jgi:hypothetical protein
MNVPFFFTYLFIYSVFFVAIRQGQSQLSTPLFIYAVSATTVCYYLRVILSRYPMAKADKTDIHLVFASAGRIGFHQ